MVRNEPSCSTVQIWAGSVTLLLGRFDRAAGLAASSCSTSTASASALRRAPLARRQRRCSASGRPARRAPGRSRKARQIGRAHSSRRPEAKLPTDSRIGPTLAAARRLRPWPVSRPKIRRQPSLGTQVDRDLLAKVRPGELE